MKINAAYLSALLILSACVVSEQTGSYAYRANTTNAQKANDSLNCEVEAMQTVPANQQVATTPVYRTPVYVPPSTTTCSGYSCYTTGGQVTGGQTYGGQVYSYDANAELRKEVQGQCLQRKGYTLVPAKLCASNQIPENLTASMSDRLVKPEGNFCIALVAKRVGIPVRLD